MHKLLQSKGKAILLGNAAIVRGTLESGIGFASTYPGTPASEIGDTFAEIAKEAGIYFEYSVNEKVATEAAAGAAFCGVRSLVSFKHFGFNVASDSIFPLIYHGVKAGMVIVVADDPNCLSSGQSEQDSRYFSRIGHIPMLEPSDASECKEFTKIAFELSEKYHIPFLIRMTTRVCHSSGVVNLGKIKKGKTQGKFVKENEWNNMPPKILEIHLQIHEKLGKIKEWNEKSKINFIVNGKGKIGIITTGFVFNYVMDALEKLKLKIPVLKIGFTYPLPENKIANFIKRFKSVLVVEELEPVLENEVKRIAKDANPKLEVNGKNILPMSGEFRIEKISNVICKLTGRKFYIKPRDIYVPERTPVLCPGCPHRASFWSAKSGGDAIFGGDIGCYILGIYKPLETQDFIISMGANEGILHGIKKVSKQKSISFVGDSTFFHAGIPGIINMVYNKSNQLVIVLDNGITAMTGHQPTPGIGITGMGEQGKKISIEEILKACGIENITVVNPFNIKEMSAKVKEMLGKNGVNAIVARGGCRLLFMRNARKKGIVVPIYQIDQNKCTKCGICLYKFGCPAIHFDELTKEFYIEEDFCWGCTVCSQICPVKAILPKVIK